MWHDTYKEQIDERSSVNTEQRKEELGREERKGKGGRRKERDDFVDMCLTVFK